MGTTQLGYKYRKYGVKTMQGECTTKVKVRCEDKKTGLIEEFSSISECSIKTGIPNSTISQCVQKNKGFMREEYVYKKQFVFTKID